ncbi:hypothetical protein Trydic_g19016 [Trypoxylus dichotomus]
MIDVSSSNLSKVEDDRANEEEVVAPRSTESTYCFPCQRLLISFLSMQSAVSESTIVLTDLLSVISRFVIKVGPYPTRNSLTYLCPGILLYQS